MTFNHIEIDYPSLVRETIDGVRYYDTPNGKKLVSITSVISHYNREIFREWEKRLEKRSPTSLPNVSQPVAGEHSTHSIEVLSEELKNFRVYNRYQRCCSNNQTYLG